MSDKFSYSDCFIDSVGDELDVISDSISDIIKSFPVLGYLLGTGADVQSLLYDISFSARTMHDAAERCLHKLEEYRKGGDD